MYFLKTVDALTVQIRLLRVLQERVYEPLGSNQVHGTNARVIAATHRDMEQLVKQGRFREDLYFRINVIKLALPALSERKEDIPLRLSTGLTLREIERYAIQQALYRNHWKKMAAARELGIDKNTLRRKIDRLEIRKPHSD